MTAFPVRRLRRLRQSPALRRLVAETDLSPRRLVLPVFVKEDIAEAQPIASMPGVHQYPLAQLAAVVDAAAEADIGGIMLFGVPAVRDAVGSGATDPDGILNRAIAVAAAAAKGRLTVQADLCLDEFTDHGHCGVLAADGSVDNDATLEVYARMALAQAEAGADILGLSGMMDGQVAACRAALDAAGRSDVVILAYSAKYASAFYGPFRDAVESTLTGDRRTYQLGRRQRPRGRAGGPRRHRRGRRHRHGQARGPVSRCARRGRRRVVRAGLGLPGVGGVRDDRARRRRRCHRP